VLESASDRAFEIGLCNAAGKDLAVWLEPWCDEFILPPRAELSLRVESDGGADAEPLIEARPDALTIYGAGNSRIRARVDGIEQDTGSASITSPDFGPLSSRGFVDLVFGEFPEARPHGRPAPTRFPWLRRIFGKA